MKRTFNILLTIAVVSLLAACNCGGENNQEAEGNHDGHHEGAAQPTSSTGNFGEVISSDNAIVASELPLLLADKEEIEVKLVGNVAAVCQMTGCWMDVEIGDGEIVHVTFKDDEFLMPKDATGKKAIIEGVATYEEIPVSMLKHLAEDEGKSQEEINAITEPAMEYTFVAKGVILQ
jgi:hypothetical protein